MGTTMNGRRSGTGFTLTELMIALAIVAALLAIVLPVFTSARGRARQASCLSNQRQLGVALLAYVQDADDQAPTGLSPTTLFAGRLPLNTAWAGRIYPYVRSPDVFRCPADGTPAVTGAGTLAEYAVSYGLNRNLSDSVSADTTTATAPSRTALLFEVTQSAACVTLEDEGLSVSATRVSPVGNGVDGTLLGWTRAINTPGNDSFALYETGRMDNSVHGTHDDYRGRKGRHGGGANYLALDGHVVWLRGAQVSSGFSARRSTDAQSADGCSYIGDGLGPMPCAEGATAGRHRLTFSVR